jgi:hypothetical protein
MPRFILPALVLAGLAVPTVAQTPPAQQPTNPAKELPYDRGYDVQTPKHDAVDAVEKPETEKLNQSAEAVDTAVTRQNEKQYALDQTAYRAAVAARREKMQMDEVTFQRQSSAYADAMAAWRVQVRACEEGKKAVCEMPAPRPQDFY